MEFKNYMGIYASSGDVQTAIDNGQLNKPYVALVGNDVDYNTKYYDPKEHYLTFEILSDGVINWMTNNLSDRKTIYYRKNGSNWVSIKSNYKTQPSTINVQAGDIIEFKGDYSAYGGSSSNNYFGNSTCGFKVKGNIMSLISSTGFTTATTLESAYTFNPLFSNCTGLTDASQLVLPATTLVYGCYYSMFYGCTGITTAPALPATTLANGCYNSMFYGCTGITTAPVLPATTLTERCYYHMFDGCSNLNYIKCLATDISASDCVTDWVTGVQTTSGTFIKASGMNDWTTGINGIPSNWTVVDAS